MAISNHHRCSDQKFRRWRCRLFVWAISLPIAFLLAGCQRSFEPRDDAQGHSPRSAVYRPEKPIVQIGHAGQLDHVVFSPNGKYLLTTSINPSSGRRGGRIMLWDATRGTKLREYDGQLTAAKPMFCLDGSAFVHGSKMYDLLSDSVTHLADDPELDVTGQAVSPNGTRLVTTDSQGTVQIRDLERASIEADFSLANALSASHQKSTSSDDATYYPNWYVQDCAFDESGDALVLVKHDRLSIWNIVEQRRQIEFDTGIFDYARFSPDARYVVTRHWDDTGSPTESAIVYNASTGEQLVASDEWSYDENSIQFTDDGRYCVTGTAQQSATLWDLSNGRQVRTFGGHDELIYSIQLLAGRNILETRSIDVAHRWDWQTGELLHSYGKRTVDESGKTYISSPRKPMVCASPNGKTYLFDCKVFDSRADNLLHELQPRSHEWNRQPSHVFRPRKAYYMPDSRNVLIDFAGSSRSTNIAALFDVSTGEMIQEIAFSPVQRFGLQWSRDGRRALTNHEGLHRLWNVDTGLSLQTIGRVAKRTVFPFPQISFTKNGNYIFVHGRQFGLFFWDANSGTPWQHQPPGRATGNLASLLDGHKHARYYNGRSALSADRRLAASWYDASDANKHKMLVWDLESATQTRSFETEPPWLPVHPYFSLDSNYLAAVCVGEDRQIVVWELESERRLFTYRPERPENDYGTPSVRFLNDKQHVLVNSGFNELTRHDIRSGQIICRMLDIGQDAQPRQPGRLRETILLSPDEKFVLADYSSDYSIVWNVQTGEDVLLIDRRLGGITVDRYFQFSDDNQSLLTRYKPATKWDLTTGESELLDLRTPLDDIPGFASVTTVSSSQFAGSTQLSDDLLDRFGHKIPASSLRVDLTADQRRLIVTQDNGSVTIWDIESAEPVYDCFVFENGGHWLTVYPDGRSVGNIRHVRVPSQPARR